MKIHTEAVHFTADQKLLDFIERKLTKLETFFDRILDVQVILKLENIGQVRDKVAELIVHIPGGQLIAKETNKTFEVAIDEATESIRRQLIKTKEMQALNR